MKKYISLSLFFIMILALLSGCGKQNLVLSGSVESEQYDVISEVSGKVLSVDFKEGDNIKKDAQLVTVDSSVQELTVKQQEAVVRIKQAKLDELKDSPNSDKLQKSIDAASADLDQSKAALEQAKFVLGKYRIKSTVEGTALIKSVKLGDMVTAGSPVCTLSKLDELYLDVFIPESKLSLIKLNQELDLTSPSSASDIIKGRITYISDKAEFTPKNTETVEAKQNTVFKVRMDITKIPANFSLKPGMTLQTEIKE